jgi:hypothetical protein
MNSGGGVRRIEITERESPVFGVWNSLVWETMSGCIAQCSVNSIRDIA